MAPAARDLEGTAEQIHELLRASPTSSPTHRALHARGTLATGTFRASSELAGRTTAAHLQGGDTPAVVRFSHPAGDPAGADSVPSSRGCAVKLRTLAGPHDLVAVSAPAFPVRDGRAFLDLLAARAPDPATGGPDPERMGAFMDAHPESLPVIAAAMAARVPRSYATLVYNGLHTFFLIDAAGSRQPFRYSWEPPGGESFLDPDETIGLDLAAELGARLEAGAAVLDLVVRLGEPGDPTDDPTAIWPERPSIVAGRLEIRAVHAETEPVIFDPSNVTDGLGVPDGDEILALRRLVYGLSYAHRTTEVPTTG